jgi:hypothetical protein
LLSRYGYWLRAGRSGFWAFNSRRGLRIFLFTTASRLALGPTQPPIQWIPGALSPPSSSEVKECVELYLHSPIRLHDVVLG